MPFSEVIKQKVKEHAHSKCCLCREAWASDVHHIIPESEGGSDTEDNAAPLCANCHDLLGANPEKRKFIKQTRDFWYDLCEKKSPPDPEIIRGIHERLSNVATKVDVQKVISYIEYKFQNIMSQPITPKEQLIRLSDVTAISTAAISDVITVQHHGSTCPKCYHSYDIETNKCSYCGWSKSDSLLKLGAERKNNEKPKVSIRDVGSFIGGINGNGKVIVNDCDAMGNIDIKIVTPPDETKDKDLRNKP